LEHGVDADRVWEASRFIDEHVTSQMPALPIPPRITLRTAFNRLPVGLVSELDARLRMLGAGDRLDEVLEEFKQVRLDCGVPPLAQPVGGILAGQAVRHVLSARRWDEVSPDMRDYLSGVYGNPPQEIAPAAAAHADPAAAVDASPALDQMRAEGLAASEEDLLLVALFGDDASRLLATLRGRGDREDAERDGLERSQSERIRELIEMVEGSDVGELTVEDAGVRITVRRQDDRPLAPVASAPAVMSADNGAAESAAPSVSQTVTVPSPMVGTFYRSPSPTAEPFVSEGDTVAVDQVLCVLEAMKLFNELKSEHAGVIRAVLVGNAEPVEYGQPLFELELA
ncbi:MAG TPA: acetyl-CoA carboxylase biotin carboxyl carrier protein, partial [Gaiellales bacterium]|nr:acetyl-CoA carboxylase biotin carboxyl carrier protein [Gaiellales bacterium]